MESNRSRHWIFQEHNIFLPIKEVRTMNFISEVDELLNTSWPRIMAEASYFRRISRNSYDC